MPKERVTIFIDEATRDFINEIKTNHQQSTDSESITWIIKEYQQSLKQNHLQMSQDIQMILNMMLHFMNHEGIEIQYQPQQFEMYHQLKHQLSELMKGNYKTTMVPKKEKEVDTSIHEDYHSSISSLNTYNTTQTSDVEDFLDQYRV